ncbi:(Fe-S)-binding protein [Fibrobacterota bacterium]
MQRLIPEKQSSLKNCVHCGLCLDVCPTYQLSGNENNSPRGRLYAWRAVSEGRVKTNRETDAYLNECLGCLACQTVCPSNVPYGDLLNTIKMNRTREGADVHPVNRIIGGLVRHAGLLPLLGFPVRMLRKSGWTGHRFFFPGGPAVFLSTSAYAERLTGMFKPTGPSVTLFTGCVMESFFREINFATVRVLLANNIRVHVPRGQACCGAVLEHNGLPGKEELVRRNQEAFFSSRSWPVLANSAGCGLSLKSYLDQQVQDVVCFLDGLELKRGEKLESGEVYLDIPCHLYHGQKIHSLPARVFQALGTPWRTVPEADACCGSGGTYHLTHSHNAEKIIKQKSAFLYRIEASKCVLATSNHVCMMQWNSVIKQGPLRKKVSVKHVIQLLDESYQGAGLYPGDV